MLRVAALRYSTSRHDAPRPLVTMQNRFARDCLAARASSSSRAWLTIGYFSIAAVETRDCEQYPQSSGHSPLFAFISTCKCTFTPQKCRRTRYVSATSPNTSASAAPKTAAHSLRVNASPAIALSASAAKLVVWGVVVMGSGK